METEIEQTNSSSVFCNGHDSLNDHPKIYLEIDPEIGSIDCPYCNKRFVLILPEKNRIL